MKNKHFLLCCAVLCPASFLLRLVQYFTVIDENGYFTQGGIVSTALSWSVYGLLALCALLAVITSLSKRKQQISFKAAVGGKGIGFLFIAAAVFLMISSGIQFMSASYDFTPPITHVHIPHILTIISAVLGVVSAIYYALLGIAIATNASPKSGGALGIFAPLYFAFCGICDFYTTFDSAGQSETKLFMLTLCMLALFSMSLSLSQVDAEVYAGRIVGVSGVLTVIAALTGPAYLLATLFMQTSFNVFYTVQALLHTVVMLVAFIVLMRLSYTKPSDDTDEIEPIQFDPLNKFINEIPDEDRGNNEQ